MMFIFDVDVDVVDVARMSLCRRCFVEEEKVEKGIIYRAR
jgi:hypothetical protein